MRMLAHSPRHWEKYVGLLGNPLARLVDLLVIKQGERIAHMKGWKLPRPIAPKHPPRRRTQARAAPRRRPLVVADQPSLFELG